MAHCSMLQIGEISTEVVASAGGRADGRTWWTWEDSDRPSKSTVYSGKVANVLGLHAAGRQTLGPAALFTARSNRQKTAW